jgi:hypothetical protein
MEPLKEGETICPECNGTGKNGPGKRLGIIIACRKCLGTGKLDWLERIFGKNIRIFNPYNSMTLPILQKFCSKLIVKELVSVQPMNIKLGDEDDI